MSNFQCFGKETNHAELGPSARTEKQLSNLSSNQYKSIAGLTMFGSKQSFRNNLFYKQNAFFLSFC